MHFTIDQNCRYSSTEPIAVPKIISSLYDINAQYYPLPNGTFNININQASHTNISYAENLYPCFMNEFSEMCAVPRQNLMTSAA